MKSITTGRLVALNLVLLLFSLSYLFLALRVGTSLGTDERLQNNVQVGGVDLSNLTLTEASQKLKTLVEKETAITFPHRVRRVTYSDLGITFKYDLLPEYLKQCSPVNIFCREKKMPIPLSERILILDESKFNSFVKELNEEAQLFLQGPEIDFDTLSFSARDTSGEVKIDDIKLKNQLKLETILSGKDLEVETRVEYPNGYEMQKQKTAELVDQATAASLLIKYGRQPIYIPAETLASFVAISEAESSSTATVSAEAIESYLNEIENSYDVEVDLEMKDATLSIAYALLYRVGGESPYTAVILPQKGISNTDGSYAKKYLEIDKSQQRMYAFENGKVVDTYIVGTGLTWETPAGDFQILRKEGMAISYSGGWYMPYYMPIGTVNGGYFFGFHEIPYKIDGNGNIASRNVNTMGSPATGGCIQLYREDSAHVYDWADLGMPVVIYE